MLAASRELDKGFQLSPRRSSLLTALMLIVNVAASQNRPDPPRLPQDPASIGPVLAVLRHRIAILRDHELLDRCSVLDATGATDSVLDAAMSAFGARFVQLDSLLTAHPCTSNNRSDWRLQGAWRVDSVHFDSLSTGLSRSHVFTTLYNGVDQWEADYILQPVDDWWIVVDLHEHDWTIRDQSNLIRYPGARFVFAALVAAVERAEGATASPLIRFVIDSTLLEWPWLYNPQLEDGGLSPLPSGYVIASTDSVLECSKTSPVSCRIRNNGRMLRIDTLILFDNSMTSILTWSQNIPSKEFGLQSRKWKLKFQLRNDEWILDESVELLN
jgi:hypothetical protein